MYKTKKNKISFHSFSNFTPEDLIPDGNDSDPDYKEPSDVDSSEEKDDEDSSNEQDNEEPTRKDVSAVKKKNTTKPVLLTKKPKANTQTRKPRTTKKVTEEGKAQQSNYILNVILIYQFCYKFNSYKFHILLHFQNSIANIAVRAIASWEAFTTMCQQGQILNVQGNIFRELQQPQSLRSNYHVDLPIAMAVLAQKIQEKYITGTFITGQTRNKTLWIMTDQKMEESASQGS